MNAERNLRRVLAANAASSAVAAVGGVALAGPIGRLLDVPTWSVVVVAAALVPWAVAVGELARSAPATLLRCTPWVVAGDVAWVVATAALLAAGLVDRSGWWLPVPMAVAVADLAVAQWLLWRRASPGAPAPVGGLATS